MPISRLSSHRYTGLDTNVTYADNQTDPRHTYAFNVTRWGAGDVHPTVMSGTSSFLESSMPHMTTFDELGGLNASFVDATGLVETDTWTVLMSTCGADNPLPTGASILLTSVSGTEAVGELTLDRGFEGAVSGLHDVYLVNQHFTVRAAGTEVQSVTVAKSGGSSAWVNGSPSYRFTFNGSSPTSCLPHDAEDWELEVREKHLGASRS